MKTSERGSWGSNIGFLLAAIGSAVGLGNIWGFPYKMGKCGGFLFLLVYLALAVFVGFSIMCSELALGRKTGSGPILAYKNFTKRFAGVGWLALIAPFLIMTFYSVLGGYCIYYIIINCIGIFGGMPDSSSFGTMLTSPWISIGGYAAAAGTQVLRIEHNAHWMNDVFMGAGIGVVSTNLAYYITDKILGRKGIAPLPTSPRGERLLDDGNVFPQKGACWGSGFRLVTGTETNGRSLSVADFAEAAEGFDMSGVTLRTSASITTGVEAEWFLSNYFSLSAIGRYTLSQAKLEIPHYAITAWGELTRIYHGDIAAGWSYPVRRDVRFGARTLWGIRYNEGVTFRQVTEGHQVGPELLSIGAQLRPAGGAGITIDLLQRYNQTVGFSFDFLHTFGTSFMPNRWVIASSWKAMF